MKLLRRSRGVAPGASGFLTRLARDKRGNTLAIMAAMIIPVLGFTGGAVDMARLYVVKVRLQQACDAGALAGRKAMTDTTKPALDDGSAKQAQTFFANNFHTGWFGTSGAVFKPTKASVGSSTAIYNAVNGKASVTVPMTITAIFGGKPAPLEVTCQAIFELADTDVMFILDTTGSMSAVPSDGGHGNAASYLRDDGIQASYDIEASGSKVDGLRQAVISFDKTMTENKQSDTVVRYGFAPYSTVVNVGKLMSSGSITSDLSYNTRVKAGDYDTSNVTKVTGVPKELCVSNGRYPTTGYTNGISYSLKNGSTLSVSGLMAAYATFTGTLSWSGSSNGTCSSSTAAITVTRPTWNFGSYPLNVSSYAGLNVVPTPGLVTGATSKWRGCVELTGTSNATSFSPDSLPSDLDPDVTPNWRPMWPEAVWRTKGVATSNVQDEKVVEGSNTDANGYYNYGALSNEENGEHVTCPMEARTLDKMTSDQVNNYVNATNFKTKGNTYHDYGMTWGLRMLSLKGPFSSTALAASGRKQASQNIVFMTDGAPATDSENYQMYGIEQVDGRLASGNDTQEGKNHTARQRALCDAAKQRGITIYMIAFGTSLTTEMKYCGSPGQSFQANDSASLQAAFSSIAKRIAMLRVNQ